MISQPRHIFAILLHSLNAQCARLDPGMLITSTFLIILASWKLCLINLNVIIFHTMSFSYPSVKCNTTSNLTPCPKPNDEFNTSPYCKAMWPLIWSSVSGHVSQLIRFFGSCSDAPSHTANYTPCFCTLLCIPVLHSTPCLCHTMPTSHHVRVPWRLSCDLSIVSSSSFHLCHLHETIPVTH